VRILVPNLGSTSLKYQLIETEGEKVLARGKIERIGSAGSPISTWDAVREREVKEVMQVPDHRAAVKILIDKLTDLGKQTGERHAISAVGFKAVHGGPRYCGSFQVDDELLAAMQEFVPVAPVHNPIYIQAMQIFREVLHEVPMVAVFETGFHAAMPERAYTYGVPHEWQERHGIRRYGFHGSSHRYVARRVPEILARPASELRIVSCHLGGSSSICAVREGKSVDSSFGFSAQSGIEHATRCGDLDPFIILHVMEREKLTPAQAGEVLCKKGGLFGISGLSSDLRDLEEAASMGHRRSALAVEVLVYEVKKYIGAFAAAMGGLNAVAFAGGIGENSWRVRQEVCRDMEFLGIHLDGEVNCQPARADRIISSPASGVAVLVVYTNEEIVVARETVRVLAESSRQYAEGSTQKAVGSGQ
jgi:acetate kinase